MCYGHWVLRFVLSHTKQGVRFVTGIGFCILCFYTRNKVCDFLPALGSASCDITHATGGYDLLRALGLSLVISHTKQGGTICYGHWV